MPKSGKEAMDEIAEAPNLDRFFDKNPRFISPDEMRELIKLERERRALFIEKRSK